MDIKRLGANRKTEWKRVCLDNLHISWSHQKSCIELQAFSKSDFLKDGTSEGNGQYDYVIHLSVEELNEMIKAAASAAIAKPHVFEDRFEPILKALVQLQAVASGVAGTI